MAQTTKEKNKLCQIFWGKKEKQPLFKFQRLNVFKRRFPSSIPKHVKINKRRQKHHSIKKWHNIQTLHKTLKHFISSIVQKQDPYWKIIDWALTDALAWTTFLAMAARSIILCLTAMAMFTVGALTTKQPCSVAATRSTLSILTLALRTV